MIPIFEQGNSQGIGHSLDTMIDRFIEICNQHKSEKRATSFAFLFYNFENSPIRDILKSKGGFAKLDRLSGKDLSVFYLNSDNAKTIESFHNAFQKAFEVKEKTKYPFVLLFDVDNDDITNLEVLELEQDNPLFAFNELYGLLENKIINLQNNEDASFNVSINKMFALTSKEISNIGVTEFVKLIFNTAYKAVLESQYK